MCLPHRATAQGAPATLPVGAARITLDATVILDPARTWTVGSTYLRFVAPRVQVGVGTDFSGVAANGNVFNNGQLLAVGNYVVPLGSRFHAYAGGRLGAFGSFGSGVSRGGTLYGGQVGLLRFVAPAAALRAQVTWAESRFQGRGSASTSASLTLDPYVGGPAVRGARWAPATLGAVDVDVLASATFAGEDVYSGRLVVAPFLARWAQIGARYQTAYFATYGLRSQALTAFGRLYVPLAGRTTPFAEGFAAWSTYADGRDGALSRYGALGGVRRYLNTNVALDAGVEWTRQPAYEFAPGRRFRPADQTSLRLGLATHLRRRSAR